MHEVDFVNILKLNYNRINVILEHYLNLCSYHNKNLIQAMRHSVLIGGKRIRPFLVYQIGQLFGIEPTNLHVPAAAVEFIHAYSLIHDDLPVMDNDTLRRGQPTCHIKYGENIAILAGNALQALAFMILSSEEIPKVSVEHRLQMIYSLADASGANGMCLGQALDLNNESKRISITQLENIYQYKTGLLIRAAVRIGALAAGDRSIPILKLLDCFASLIGLGFQIQDDILDVIGNSKKTGKNNGADQRSNKNTYPALLGLNKAQNKVHELYDKSLIILKTIKSFGYNTDVLTALAKYVIERDH